MMTIRQIDAETTFAVRHSVLRAGKPIETCKFDGDNLDTTIHFGSYDDDNLIGVASIYEKRNPLFPNLNQFQLRGMAVLTSHQKMGIGAQLFKRCYDYCINTGNSTLWFNARTAAVPFYQNLNCQIVGTPFLIPEVGEHYIMVLD